MSRGQQSCEFCGTPMAWMVLNDGDTLEVCPMGCDDEVDKPVPERGTLTPHQRLLQEG